MDKNFTLTKEEQKEIERRGFFIKKTFTIGDLLNSLPIFVVVFGVLIFFGILMSILTIILVESYASYIVLFFVYLLSVPSFLLLIRTCISYIFLGKTFYFNEGGIAGKILSKNPFKTQIARNFQFFKRLGLTSLENVPLGKTIGFIFILCWLPFFGFEKLVEFGSLLEVDILRSFAIPIASLFLGIIFCAIIGRFIFQSFHPLYAFGNLGEKIQNLTPVIEMKSREIQKNFQKDMNFHTLSEGFDSLSKTFTEIIELVIKLERVEKRANKGNLFDSEKYIDSLRSDIVEPLKQLRVFLEKQKVQLEHSQEELQKVRVRVGGPLDSGINQEGLSQAELSSKRSTPLISELTENIEKLDVMIEQMG